MQAHELIYIDKSTSDGVHIAVSRSDFEKFSSALLRLGDIEDQPSGSERFDALAAVFDLEGFTRFCDRRDPHLAVPDFLDRFLSWLFQELRSEFQKKTSDDQVLLWAYLPMFAKFMGDGVLFLWRIPKDDRHGGGLAIGNIVVRLNRIATYYRTKFLPIIINDFTDPPRTLRCGGAVGSVISIGDGKDYVGACINLASRLQKAGGLSFAFARDGCDPQNCFRDEWKDVYVIKNYQPRGFEKAEKILVEKSEFAALPENSKREFS